jgi:hypothetical protein
MHCFKKLKGCKKWDEVQLTLKEADDGEGPTHNTVASVGCPHGQKKARSEKLAASSATSGIDASITKMVESMTKNSKESHERSMQGERKCMKHNKRS